LEARSFVGHGCAGRAQIPQRCRYDATQMVNLRRTSLVTMTACV
jgi:hypothetical protein